MNPASKFSLILMHDDGRTHRMRVSRGLFRLLVTLLVLAPLLGILGLWVGFEAWRTMADWQQERTSYQSKLDETRVHLERLSTLEALLKSEESANGPLGPALAANTNPMPHTAATPAPGNQASPPQTAAGASTPDPAASSAPASSPSGTAAAASTAPTNPANSAQPANATEQASTALAENANATDDSEGDGPPDERRKAVNTGKMRVENMQARLIDRRRLRASVDLYNAEASGRQLGGKTVFSLLTADGRQFPLSNEDAAFRISRFKKVVTTSTLPVPPSELENAAIVVEVIVSGTLVYRNLFSIETR